MNPTNLTPARWAMAVALMYPEAEKLKRSGSLKIKELEGINDGYISQARTVLKYAPIPPHLKPITRF